MKYEMPIEENMQKRFIEKLRAVSRSLPRLIELAEEGKIEKVDVEELWRIKRGERKDIPVKEVTIMKILDILSFTL